MSTTVGAVLKQIDNVTGKFITTIAKILGDGMELNEPLPPTPLSLVIDVLSRVRQEYQVRGHLRYDDGLDNENQRSLFKKLNSLLLEKGDWRNIFLVDRKLHNNLVKDFLKGLTAGENNELNKLLRNNKGEKTELSKNFELMKERVMQEKVLSSDEKIEVEKKLEQINLDRLKDNLLKIIGAVADKSLAHSEDVAALNTAVRNIFEQAKKEGNPYAYAKDKIANIDESLQPKNRSILKLQTDITKDLTFGMLLDKVASLFLDACRLAVATIRKEGAPEEKRTFNNPLSKELKDTANHFLKVDGKVEKDAISADELNQLKISY